jgi:uncharacterized BrkB/YihY/UPF0761 family membrane protein
MASGKGASDYLTELLIIGVLCASLLGSIMSSFNSMTEDTTNYTTVQIAVISVFGILIVIGVLNLVLKASGLKKGK